VVTVQFRDDEGSLRDRLARWLATDARLKIVRRSGASSEAPEDVDAITRLVLLDLQMPSPAGPDRGGKFSAAPSMIHVLVVPADFDKKPVTAAQLTGARSDEGSPESLVSRLLGLPAGSAQEHLPRRERLSGREVNVLAQVAAGLSNKQIAKLLGISQKTVRNHLSRIFSKLGASNRTEAVMNAMRLGLLVI
jgi:DNA-binding NarL/FixJ family response regulator